MHSRTLTHEAAEAPWRLIQAARKLGVGNTGSFGCAQERPFTGSNLNRLSLSPRADSDKPGCARSDSG
jgi:hypothetical protein